MRRPLIEMAGKRFGRLTVLHRADKTRWVCQCDCGNTTASLGWHLRGGRSRSCGCIGAEKLGNIARKHGLSKLPEYQVWLSMKARCTNPKNKEFKNYAARGIAVCDAWLNSFEQFLADMGRKPSPSHTIERTDNDKGYSPDNCCWATRSVQIMNRRKTVFLEHNGERMNTHEASARFGIAPSTIRRRLDRGWSVERALSPAAASEREERDLLAERWDHVRDLRKHG